MVRQMLRQAGGRPGRAADQPGSTGRGPLPARDAGIAVTGDRTPAGSGHRTFRGGIGVPRPGPPHRDGPAALATRQPREHSRPTAAADAHSITATPLRDRYPR